MNVNLIIPLIIAAFNVFLCCLYPWEITANNEGDGKPVTSQMLTFLFSHRYFMNTLHHSPVNLAETHDRAGTMM